MQDSQSDLDNCRRLGVDEQYIKFRLNMKKFLKSKIDYSESSSQSPPNGSCEQTTPNTASESPPTSNQQLMAKEEKPSPVKPVVHPPLPLEPPPPDSPPIMPVPIKNEIIDNEYPDEETSQESPNLSSAETEEASLRLSFDGRNTEEPDSTSMERPKVIVCRDFIRGTCSRFPCRYAHQRDLSQLSGVYTFCRNFQNTVCTLPLCKYVHATVFEEQEFYRTGVLPAHAQNHTKKPYYVLPPSPPPPPEEAPPDVLNTSALSPRQAISQEKPLITCVPVSKLESKPVENDISHMLQAITSPLKRDWNLINPFSPPPRDLDNKEIYTKKCKHCDNMDIRLQFNKDKFESIEKSKRDLQKKSEQLGEKSHALFTILFTVIKQEASTVSGINTLKSKLSGCGEKQRLPGKLNQPRGPQFDFCEDLFNLTSRGKIKALIQKNFLRMWRNIGVMLFIFVLLVMQVILFCLAIGRDPSGLRLAIVNNDVNVMNGLCPYNSSCSMKNLSCRYLDHLRNQSIIKEYYADLSSALAAVREGDAWGAIYFNENYTDSLVARLALADTADEETIESSEVQVWLDMSNQQIGLMLNRDIQFSYRDFAKDLLATCDYNPKVGDIPIDFKEPIYGDNNPSFTDNVAPGVILTIVFFLAVALTSSALIVERMEGLLDRSWVAGVSPGEILFSHVVTQFVVMVGQTALVLVFMILVFGVKCNGNIALVVMLTLLQGLCGMCFGFVISAACELERNAIQLALGSFYPTLLLSGVIWPIEGMPWILRYVSLCLPLTLATTSLRSILTRGWPLADPEVYMGFVSTLVWIAMFLIVTLTILRFKRG